MRWRKTRPGIARATQRCLRIAVIKRERAEDLSFEIFDDCVCGYNAGLAWEDLLGKNTMYFIVDIGAAVCDDNQVIIHVSGPAYC